MSHTLAKNTPTQSLFTNPRPVPVKIQLSAGKLGVSGCQAGRLLVSSLIQVVWIYTFRKMKKAPSGVDQLSDNLAKMSLIPDNDRRKKKSSIKQQTSLSELDVLEEGRKMFVFQDVSSQDNRSDIVQETVDSLPDGE